MSQSPAIGMPDTRRAVLEAIASGPVSGPALADERDVSRAAIWKHIEALRAAGFAIESGSDGYELTAIEAYTGPTVEFGLEAPFAVEFHDSIASTNDRARDLAGEGADDVAVLADEQVGGRGRLDREWAGPAGGVWLSVLTRPAITPVEAPLYTLIGAVAIARSCREAGVDARIKWPNDVVVPTDDSGQDYRKLAGILTEMEGEPDRIDWLVVGMGINANVDADDLPAGATSVRAEVGDVDRRVFVQRVLETVDELRDDLERIVPAWRELALTLGQRVRIDRPDGELVGEAVDVTATGALVIESADGRETVAAGDCEHVRPA